ncbi:zf-HC2 domain-containing protein [Chloroflexi bacterium TSY]|nr:zf-HC2 domain-containing protein [Chloroflexi bacterium TSY]
MVTDYLENALSPQARARFEEHLASCEGCDIYLKQMEQTIRATGMLSEESISEPAKTRLLQAFRDWKKS